MIVKELEAISIEISNGTFRAVVGAQTDRGVVGMNLAFSLKENPELDALLVPINVALQQALNKTLGLQKAADAPPPALEN